MRIDILFNNGKVERMDIASLRPEDAQTFARQISGCMLVHTVRLKRNHTDIPLHFRDGNEWSD